MTGPDIGGWFPIPAEEDLPEDLRKLFAKARASLGFVPNVFRTYSFRPDRLRTWFAHFKALHVPTEHLDAAAREMICSYAEKLTRSPRDMTDDDLAALREQGLTEEECWDVAEVAAMYNFTNRMAAPANSGATNMLPNEEYHALARQAGARTS